MGEAQPLFHRIDKARTLLGRKEYAALLDEISSRVLPAGNPLLYWDRCVIVQLGQPRLPRRQPECVPTLATSNDIELLCQQRPDRRALIEARVRDGQSCFVIHDGGQIVARQWVVGDRPVYQTNSGYRFVPPARPAAWCHDIFVDPHYRMRGHFVAMMLNARKQGDRARPPHLYGEIHFLNGGSIRAHTSFGYRIIRTVTVGSLLGWKLYLVEDDGGRRTFETRHLWRVPHI